MCCSYLEFIGLLVQALTLSKATSWEKYERVVEFTAVRFYTTVYLNFAEAFLNGYVQSMA